MEVCHLITTRQPPFKIHTQVHKRSPQTRHGPDPTNRSLYLCGKEFWRTPSLAALYPRHAGQIYPDIFINRMEVLALARALLVAFSRWELVLD